MKANLPRNHRSLISKLKVGTLPLNLEVGRWKDKALELRLCKVCDEGFLEDEAHFIIHCSKYKATRTTYLQEIIDETDCKIRGDEYSIMSTFA